MNPNSADSSLNQILSDQGQYFHELEPDHHQYPSYHHQEGNHSKSPCPDHHRPIHYHLYLQPRWGRHDESGAMVEDF